jgi:8-oxo-dGTP diphosphatase
MKGAQMPDREQEVAAASRMVRVAAAVLTDDCGRVLLARRRAGLHLAGLWEFPGGKLENGESPEAALERELLEELHVRVAIHEHLGSSHHTYPGRDTIELISYRGRIGSGTPAQTDHDAFAWVDPADLGQYELAPADAFLIPILQSDLS